ncbi:MAG: FHA domain-containing protein [Butyricicoccaceae bacterium]
MILALLIAVILFGGILAVIKKDDVRRLWNTYVKPNLPEAPKPPKRPAHLVIEHHGRKLTIKRNPFTIGRLDSNDLVLSDARVGRLHAKIENRGTPTDPVFYLVDCNSTNGTYVNGRPCQEHQLHSGDIIVIGNEQLRVSSTDKEGLHETMYIDRK